MLKIVSFSISFCIFMIIYIGVPILLIYILLKKPKGQRQRYQDEHTNETLTRNQHENVVLPLGRKRLLSNNEIALYTALRNTADINGLTICTKVRFEDFIHINANGNEKVSWRNRLKPRTIDFLLCNDRMEVVFGIDLDNSAHSYNSQTIQSDIIKDQVFRAIEIPFFHVQTNSSNYRNAVDDIFNKLASYSFAPSYFYTSDEHLPLSKQSLLTKAELRFYIYLKHAAISNNVIICPKIRLEEMVNITASGKERMSWRGRTKSRHIDFVLCDFSFNVVAGIELDDSSHYYNKSSIESDALKNDVFSALNIPLFHIPVSGNYNSAISDMFDQILHLQQTRKT